MEWIDILEQTMDGKRTCLRQADNGNRQSVDVEGIGYPRVPHVEIAKVRICCANEVTFFMLRNPQAKFE